MIETKDRILDAAENLFADYGFDATSLRAITHRAGVNLAAVNYHFHSKEDLIKAVFLRHIGPLNQKRLAMLDEAEARAGVAPVPVEDLLRALIWPVLELRKRHGNAFTCLFGRVYAEPGGLLKKVVSEAMRDPVIRFQAAFARALPHLEPADLLWRLHFTIGVLAHSLAAGPVLESLSDGICDPSDIETMFRQMVPFLKAGLLAPRPQRPAVGPPQRGILGT